MSTSRPAQTRVCIWPEDESMLVEAARNAGAVIVPADQAEVLVSFNGSVDGMRTALHPGIRLVQLGCYSFRMTSRSCGRSPSASM